MGDNMSNYDRDDELPAPLRVIFGLVQIAAGFAIGFVGAVLRAFPVTSALGSPLLVLAHKSSYHGGANLVSGLGGTFGMIGKGIGTLFKALYRAGQKLTAQKKLPPIE